jgi:hypothetical protein
MKTVVVLGVLLLVLAAPAEAAWRSLKPESGVGPICLSVKKQKFQYTRLDATEPMLLEVRGPRRVKIISRYLFGPDDPDTGSYTLRVLMDGEEVLRHNYNSGALAGVTRCEEGGDVAALRRSTLRVPTGIHHLQIFADPEGSGRVAARAYREVKRKKAKDVAYAPEQYRALTQLQFASGTISTYYHFDADTPLGFAVTGPTTLKVYTRLDFDHTMNGDQNYSLQLLRDGESVNTYHYHASKLSAAAYIERPEILPGDRKLLRVPVPRGRHQFELRCVRPEACGIAAQIRIPEADVKSR